MGWASTVQCPGPEAPFKITLTAKGGEVGLDLMSLRNSTTHYAYDNVLHPVMFCGRAHVRSINGQPVYVYFPVYSWRGAGSPFSISPSSSSKPQFGTFIERTVNDPESWWNEKDPQPQNAPQGTMLLETEDEVPSFSPCGCEPYADTDGDLAPDCTDACPEDAEKIEPGVCGCGQDDMIDTDGDGVVDCLDACPTNTFGSAEPCPQWGDADGDGDVDMADFADFQRCIYPSALVWYQTLPPECRRWDSDNDGYIEEAVELQQFLLCSSGPGISATNCTDGPHSQP